MYKPIQIQAIESFISQSLISNLQDTHKPSESIT